MLFKCPQCDKVIDMTLEELALSKKVVVCPQCLNEFLAKDIDIPASMLRTNIATTGASCQLYCHNCGESLPVAGLKFCPYCGSSQNLAATKSATNDSNDDTAPQATSSHALGSENLTSNEDKTVIEDDAYDMMSHLPLIRPLPVIRSRREVMGSRATRITCYIIIVILIAIFFFILYLSNFDDNGAVAKSIGLPFAVEQQ